MQITKRYNDLFPSCWPLNECGVSFFEWFTLKSHPVILCLNSRHCLLQTFQALQNQSNTSKSWDNPFVQYHHSRRGDSCVSQDGGGFKSLNGVSKWLYSDQFSNMLSLMSLTNTWSNQNCKGQWHTLENSFIGS